MPEEADLTPEDIEILDHNIHKRVEAKKNMTKITLTDTLMDIFMKLSEGNPGALTVLMEMYKHGAAIDPDVGDPILLMLNLDSLNLYGPDIWILYKDVCGENLVKFVACLRGWQLGYIERAELHAVIQACMDQRVSCTKKPRPKRQYFKPLKYWWFWAIIIPISIILMWLDNR